MKVKKAVSGGAPIRFVILTARHGAITRAQKSGFITLIRSTSVFEGEGLHVQRFMCKTYSFLRVFRIANEHVEASDRDSGSGSDGAPDSGVLHRKPGCGREHGMGADDTEAAPGERRATR